MKHIIEILDDEDMSDPPWLKYLKFKGKYWLVTNSEVNTIKKCICNPIEALVELRNNSFEDYDKFTKKDINDLLLEIAARNVKIVESNIK